MINNIKRRKKDAGHLLSAKRYTQFKKYFSKQRIRNERHSKRNKHDYSKKRGGHYSVFYAPFRRRFNY